MITTLLNIPTSYVVLIIALVGEVVWLGGLNGGMCIVL